MLYFNIDMLCCKLNPFLNFWQTSRQPPFYLFNLTRNTRGTSYKSGNTKGLALIFGLKKWANNLETTGQKAFSSSSLEDRSAVNVKPLLSTCNACKREIVNLKKMRIAIGSIIMINFSCPDWYLYYFFYILNRTVIVLWKRPQGVRSGSSVYVILYSRFLSRLTTTHLASSHSPTSSAVGGTQSSLITDSRVDSNNSFEQNKMGILNRICFRHQTCLYLSTTK